MREQIARALALMLVIEGILPFLHPHRWRQLVASLAMIDDKKLRVMGLLSMIAGVGLLLAVH
ncbi:MAG: hypothetical protein ACI9Y1_000433 [Lentisphaeria bacterium]|jgi:uncharacterized protein YjeT (DUF2065 family)